MKKPVYAVGARVRLSPLQRIIEKTGRRPTECKCHLCKRQCHTPCLGTPQDILRLIDAGYADRLAPTLWEAGVLMGVVAEPASHRACPSVRPQKTIIRIKRGV